MGITAQKTRGAHQISSSSQKVAAARQRFLSIGATNDGGAAAAAATKRRSASGTYHFSLSYSLNQFTSLLLFK
jgi:hypothetical protein